MTVEELANYYEGKVLPTEPVKLNSYSTIADPAAFVQSEFEILHHNPGHKAYDSCRLRLIEFMTWMEAQKKSDS